MCLSYIMLSLYYGNSTKVTLQRLVGNTHRGRGGVLTEGIYKQFVYSPNHLFSWYNSI